MFKSNKVDMPKNNVISDSELKQRMNNTLKFLSDTLGNTMGYYGATSIIQDRNLDHKISKDGYSVLKQIFIEGYCEQTILDLVKVISRNLVRKVGDGSTSSIVAAYGMYQQFIDIQKKYKVPTKVLLDCFSEVADSIIESIEKDKLEIKGTEDLVNIATVSTNNDPEKAKIIKDVYDRIGYYGFINLEKSKTEDSYFVDTSGFEIKRGLFGEYMLDSSDKSHSEIFDPFIIMADGVIRENHLRDLGDDLGEMLKFQRPIVIVAPGFDKAAETFLYMNKTKNDVPLYAIEVSYGTEKHNKRFDDLAICLGAKPLRISQHETFKNFVIDDCGSCKKIYTTLMKSRFVEGGAEPEEVILRKNVLKEEIEDLTRNETYIEMDDYIRELRLRLSRLEGNMATIYVGGKSEQHKETDMFLYEDAVYACGSAIEHGYNLGGNLIIPIVINRDKIGFASNDKVKRAVISAIYKGFSTPFEKVISNYTGDDKKSKNIVKECILNEQIFNLKAEQFESASNTRIINSVETDVEILRTAISIIGLISTSNQFVSLRSH